MRALGRALILLVHAGFSSGLAPTICADDVVNYVQTALSWGASITSPPNRLSTCACILDERNGFTPLHEVANRGGSRAGGVIGALVERYANVMEVDKRGATALHLAAMQGELPAAMALMDAAARVRYQTNLLIATDKDGKTAVDLAEVNGHTVVLRYLIGMGGLRGKRSLGPNECNWLLTDTVILSDVDSFLAEIGKPIVNASMGSTHADCFSPPSYRERPLLHLAVAIADFLPPPGGRDIVEALLTRGANAIRLDGAGDLPLSMAVRADRVDLVNVLLQHMHGADVNAVDRHGRTALIEAARVGARSSAAKLMMGGASMELQDDQGFTAIDYANQEGYEDVASIIHMIQRLPPATLNLPGTMFSSDDPPDSFPPDAEVEKGIDIGVVIGLIVGGVLVTCAASLIIARFIQKRGSSDKYAIDTYQEATPDESREQLQNWKKSVKNGSSKKEPNESKKKKSRPGTLMESSPSSQVPPGQILTDSSDGDSKTPPGSRSRKPPVVTLRAPGQQGRAKAGHRSLSPVSHVPSVPHAVSDSDFASPSARSVRGKPVRDRDSVSLPPSPCSNSNSRIMSTAALQAAAIAGNAGDPELGPSPARKPSHLVAKATEPPPLPALLPKGRAEDPATSRSCQSAAQLAKDVAAASRTRWNSASNGSTWSEDEAPPRAASTGGLSGQASARSAGGFSSGSFSSRDLGVQAKATPEWRGPSSHGHNGAAANVASAGLRATGASTHERGPLLFNDSQLPVSLRDSADVSSSQSGSQAAPQAPNLPKARAKPRSKVSASPAKQTLL